MSEKRHVIISTAGHVDHGKSALVKALTGVDADTLPEEKRRGLTIELGFVFLEDPDYEKQIVFIDVPGHEKFIKTMAAGASNVDGALLVVAADEGISLQTREHLEILQLMGINDGIIALSKSDLVSQDHLLELEENVRQFVSWTFLKNAPIIPVSAKTGAGIAAIKDALKAVGRKVYEREDIGFFRMPIDRVFSMRGFGTVVAGTILSGRVRVGDRLEIYPERIPVKVRGIQVHDKEQEESEIGKRTALNLQDVKKDALYRGQCLGAKNKLIPSYKFDTKLLLLKSYGKELKNRMRVRLHVGTDEKIGRVVLIDKEKLLPGDSAYVQFMLEAPSVALPGDSFIIRSFSPLISIGGGRILDAAPKRHKRFDKDAITGLQRLDGEEGTIIEQMFIKAGFLPQSAAAAAAAVGVEEKRASEIINTLGQKARLITVPTGKEDSFIHTQYYNLLQQSILDIIRKFYQDFPFRFYMPFADLRSQILKKTILPVFNSLIGAMSSEKLIIRKESGVGLPGHEPALKPREMEQSGKVENIYRQASFAAPNTEDVRSQLRLNPSDFTNLLKGLYESEKLVRLSQKVTYHQDTVKLAQELVAAFARQHGSITIAQLRNEIKMSRKYAQAILEYFDRIGLTIRRGDEHVLKQ